MKIIKTFNLLKLFPLGKGHKIINSIKRNNLTYLNKRALKDIWNVVRSLERKSVKGIFVEAGCALGGSAIIIAAAKEKERPFYIYDVFGMIPPPTEKDGNDVHDRYKIILSGESKGLGGDTYYGYLDDLKKIVVRNFKNHLIDLNENNIELKKGLFKDTLKITKEVAFAHIDSDWYESVTMCLIRIEPHLVKNGVIIIDDYYDWSGCKTAVDEYFAEKKHKFKFVRKTKLNIIRML